MSRYFLFVALLFLTACGVKLVKDEKYISTGQFHEQAMKICMTGKKYKEEAVSARRQLCQQSASSFIADAEHKFREYKADEHTYRLCRSKFANVNLSDKCFREKQVKYYQRELAGYKRELNR